jgi:inosine-uridine nucleoside N-ribohydrolase
VGFGLDDDREAREDALRQAVDEARSKAGVMADALGVDLDGILSINEGGIFIQQPMPMMESRLAAQADTGTPVSPGEVMGGAFGFNGHRGNVSPVAEANIAGDPLAADRVLTSGLAVTVVGLDVTQETIAGDDFFAALRSSAGQAGELIFQMSRYYLDFHRSMSGCHECPVHDSSAVAYLLRPNFYTTQDAAVRVVTDGIAIGQTIYSPPGASFESKEWEGQPAIRICTAVDAGKVLELYLQTLAGC